MSRYACAECDFVYTSLKVVSRCHPYVAGVEKIVSQHVRPCANCQREKLANTTVSEYDDLCAECWLHIKMGELTADRPVQRSHHGHR